MADNNLSDCFQILFCHNRSRGIIGEWQNQKLCLVCDGLFQFLRRQAELILSLQVNDHRNTICQHRARKIGYKAWLRNQYLISRI